MRTGNQFFEKSKNPFLPIQECTIIYVDFLWSFHMNRGKGRNDMVQLITRAYPNVCMAFGALFGFFYTFLMTKYLMHKLPADEGREFAVDGKLSKGKPRGAGLLFVICFIFSTLLFSPVFRMSFGYMIEILIYLVLIFIEMLTGYLDDRATKPWSRLKKGFFDFTVSALLAFTYIYCNGTKITILEYEFILPIWLMAILIAGLCWGSINVTNCADGVDGLSGTLTIITLFGFLLADDAFVQMHGFRYLVVFFIACIAAYLWFNAGPSILMMGDAGSRAMGIFICITAFKSGHVLLYIPFAIVLALDGGLGLFKVSMIKLTGKKDFFSFVRTPLHDHVRKNLTENWSNTQCVTRFSMIQLVIVILTIYLFCR